MCIGLPMQIKEKSFGYAKCEGMGITREVDTLLVGDLPIDTWVLVFLKSAREVLTEENAKKIGDAVKAIDLIMESDSSMSTNGLPNDAIEALFADLVDREPPKPPSLIAFEQSQKKAEKDNNKQQKINTSKAEAQETVQSNKENTDMPSPLIKTMIEQYNYPVLNVDNVDEFINSQNECVLFFTENPTRFPESDDVAMILPELVKEYGNRFNAAVIEQDSQRKLQARYDFREWPTLVFLRKGEYLGAISRVQDWNEYIIQINAFLTDGPKKVITGIGVPIETASTSSCSK